MSIGGYIMIDRTTNKPTTKEEAPSHNVNSSLPINAKNKLGESELFIMVREGKIEKVLELLQIPNIDVDSNRIPGDGKTTLQIAEEKGFTQIVHLLKQKKLLNEIGQKIDIARIAEDSRILL